MSPPDCSNIDVVLLVVPLVDRVIALVEVTLSVPPLIIELELKLEMALFKPLAWMSRLPVLCRVPVLEPLRLPAIVKVRFLALPVV